MEHHDRIYVAGQATLLGAALRRRLARGGYSVLGLPDDEPDFSDQRAVGDFFQRTRPEYVFVAAGKSGGIAANQRYPAELMGDNLLVACHVLEAARQVGVRKVLYLASSCTYPRECAQPMAVSSLFSGPLEPTNAAYAVAKLAGITLCRAYRTQYGMRCIAAIPANSFGPGDDFGLEDSHVVAALIRRIHEAKLAEAPAVDVWGTGAARREFVFADDLADACIFVMREYDGADPINLGGGPTVSIRELAERIADVIGYSGTLRFDPGKPDGMPAKSLDVQPLRDIGWQGSTDLRSALTATYGWFLQSPWARKLDPERVGKDR